MDTVKQNPPYRAEHVGSFLRPTRLVEAVRKTRTGQMDAEDFREIQDECIREIVDFQEDIGLGTVTDGEFRRRHWSASFVDAVEGFIWREGAPKSRTEAGEIRIVDSPYARERIRRTSGITTEEFRFLKSITKALPKVTIPAPGVMHFFLGQECFNRSVYQNIEEYFDDLISIYQEEITELAELGCRYLQLDDTALPCNCDETVRSAVQARGEDPDTLTKTYIRLANEALKVCPGSMIKGIHMCRGNLKGAWLAEGGYDPIANQIFNQLNVDTFFLEFDSERSGDFSPLRFVPATKTVILGLISTKTPTLEDPDYIKRRIDEASRYVPIERLGISPQCGFSSVAGGFQPITYDDQRRKLELLCGIANDVWGGL